MGFSLCSWCFERGPEEVTLERVRAEERVEEVEARGDIGVGVVAARGGEEGEEGKESNGSEGEGAGEGKGEGEGESEEEEEEEEEEIGGGEGVT